MNARPAFSQLGFDFEAATPRDTSVSEDEVEAVARLAWTRICCHPCLRFRRLVNERWTLRMYRRPGSRVYGYCTWGTETKPVYDIRLNPAHEHLRTEGGIAAALIHEMTHAIGCRDHSPTFKREMLAGAREVYGIEVDDLSPRSRRWLLDQEIAKRIDAVLALEARDV